MKRRILIYVYNISGYLMAEVTELLRRNVEVGIIETPCRLSQKMHDEFPQIQWFDSVNSCDFIPDTFLCGGWADKSALRLSARLRAEGATTVLLIDTPWQGTIKQYFHCVISRIYLTRLFDFAWGAGESQEKYLRRLGFQKKHIRMGYYCADTAKFSALYNPDRRPWPHHFLYVGRYIPVKNMAFMEKAFIKALSDNPGSDWTLDCIGTGILWDKRMKHSRIRHLGYKSPAELQKWICDAGAFVLPSLFEPWGVVVHEFALVGVPLLCSSRVLSASAFLRDGENGFVFNPISEKTLVMCFSSIMRKTDEELAVMGKRSHELGTAYSVGDWADMALGFKKNRL